MRRDLHFYDPLYEILFFGDISPVPVGLRQKFRMQAGAGQLQLKKYILPFITCPEVARLKWLNQAGFVNLVYPSGSHSRFAHALGTLHLGSIALNSVSIAINNEKKSLLDWLSSKGWVEEFIIALFLHDLGHYPYSHTLENNLGLKRILKDDFVAHEEVACQLIIGKGSVYDAYKKAYKGEEKRLVASVFKENKGFKKNIVCYLISGDKKYLNFRIGQSDGWLLDIMHDLVSGTFDLDRIDHYRRDSFFTGLGHSFKPYVLLYGLHYVCDNNHPTPMEQPTKEAESQISALLFIRDQLHKYCFGNLLNISYGAMLNHALTLLMNSGNVYAEEARIMLTMTDADLLSYLMSGSVPLCSQIVRDIRLARPYPCVATFPKKDNTSRDEIIKKVLALEPSVVLGFSKYYDRQEKPWLGKNNEVPDSGKGYAFAVNIKSEDAVKILRRAGVKGVADPTPDEVAVFNYLRR
jgi:HD superfamily phosphohydrolase